MADKESQIFLFHQFISFNVLNKYILFLIFIFKYLILFFNMDVFLVYVLIHNYLYQIQNHDSQQ
jgi:hypothetical protein